MLNNSNVVISFVDGPSVEVRDVEGDVFVEFIDNDTKEVVHSGMIKSNHWIKASRRWFTNWLIRLTDLNGEIAEYVFDIRGKRVLIWFDSSSVGDNLGWISSVERFRRIYKCQVVCSTFWNHLFRDTYPEIIFVEPGEAVPGLYASFAIGDYDGDINKNREEWRTVPLQKIASDILGLPYESTRPKLNVPDLPRNIKEKYVCIAIHSTLQCKYWNYPKGWQILVNYFHKIGYKVVQISKEGNWHKGNKIPNRTIKKFGSIPLEERMVDLKYADMFVGVSSGLAWLSWAIGTPTIIISGTTKPWVEPSDGVERVFNDKVCNGCLNDGSLQLNRGEWNYCPRGNDFECSKAITPEMVIEKVDKIVGQRYE